MYGKRIEHRIIDDVEYKYCGRCGTWKILSEFSLSKRTWDNLYTWCRMCSAKYHIENKEHHNELARKWRNENKEYANETSRKWHTKNKGHANEMRRKWYFENKDQTYFKHIERIYGVTYEQWNNVLDIQHDKCAVCKQPFENTKSCNIEHDHTKDIGDIGYFRGIVCMQCNILLSKCNDDITILQNLITYLQQNNNFGMWYQSSGQTYKQWKERIKRNALIAQNYKCAGCGKRLNIKTCCLDHRHDTGIISGVLCSEHNLALGHARDSILILQMAVEYLQRFEQTA